MAPPRRVSVSGSGAVVYVTPPRRSGRSRRRRIEGTDPSWLRTSSPHRCRCPLFSVAGPEAKHHRRTGGEKTGQSTLSTPIAAVELATCHAVAEVGGGAAFAHSCTAIWRDRLPTPYPRRACAEWPAPQPASCGAERHAVSSQRAGASDPLGPLEMVGARDFARRRSTSSLELPLAGGDDPTAGVSQGRRRVLSGTSPPSIRRRYAERLADRPSRHVRGTSGSLDCCFADPVVDGAGSEPLRGARHKTNWLGGD